jgi:flagellar motor switch protein FliN
MADGALSQEEIDALLGGGTLPSSGASEPSDSGSDDPFAGLMGLGDDPSSSSEGGVELEGPSSDAIAAALGQGFSPPPPHKQNTAKPTSMGSMGGNSSNLNLLMDVTLSLTVELGRTNMLIRDVLQLSEGVVVELDKTSGEDLDLLANGKLIGRGKVIVIDDYYGVMITHIVDPMERLSML